MKVSKSNRCHAIDARGLLGYVSHHHETAPPA
jgi:hypothetical protein